jgi:hypothetical protein
MTAGGDPLSALAALLTRDSPQDLPQPFAESDWLALVGLANAHLLAPTLGERLLAGGGPSDLPAETRDYLGMLLRLNARRNVALRAQATALVRGLNDVGIRPVLLKGAITLFDAGDPLRRSRMMRDIDVLVPLTDLERAVGVVRGLGYQVHERYPSGHHAYGEFAKPGEPGTVDLHTELVDPSYVLPAAELRRRARPLDVDGLGATAPAPTDRLLHHLLHAQVHHLANFYRGELRLNQVHEFAVQAERLGAAVDWSFIARRLARHRLTVPLHSYLLAAGRLFGMPWPLSAPARTAADWHMRRCCWQLRHPRAGHWLAPVGNLRAAFAWHRMNAFYGDGGTLTAPRLRHAVGFLRKKSMREVLQRLLRYE